MAECFVASLLDQVGFINLLVYGSDSKTVHQLLMTGRHLAATSLQHTSINDLIATHRKHPLGTFVDGKQCSNLEATYITL